MVFKFRMLSDENDNFVRDLEVPYDMTLRGFHEFLVRILGYEACMTSFFTADGQWERLQEYTLLDMGDPESIPMENVSLGQLLHHNRERLIYLFDQLNNRALYLELTEAKKPEPTMEYPRVAFEHAPAPDQYDPAANEDDGSIFIASEDIEACRAARQTIENIVFEPEVGELYYGKVSNIRSEFGAWVELAPGKDGLVKIKDLEFKRTEKVEDVLKIGDMTWVKVMNVDDRGRIDLSRKDAMREKGLM